MGFSKNVGHPSFPKECWLDVNTRPAGGFCRSADKIGSGRNKVRAKPLTRVGPKSSRIQ